MKRRLFPAQRAQEPGDAGFTLIEMLVVVSIIGILAAVAIPRYMAYAKSSKAAEVSNTGGAIVSAIATFADAQGLTPSQVVTKFGAATLKADSPDGTDLTALIPGFQLPNNSKFNYAVGVAVGAAGSGGASVPQAGEAVFCIKATARANSGLVQNGIVIYSSAPSGATGWDGRTNRTSIDSTTLVTTGTLAYAAGGYCDSAAAATATYTP